MPISTWGFIKNINLWLQNVTEFYFVNVVVPIVREQNAHNSALKDSNECRFKSENSSLLFYKQISTNHQHYTLQGTLLCSEVNHNYLRQ